MTISTLSNALAQGSIPPELIRAERARRAALREDQRAEATREAEIERCGRDADGVCHWFNKYVWTYDPRLIGKRDALGNALSPYVPFTLWPRQVEFIHWLWDRYEANEEGLGEKSRDTGVSYLCCGFALNRWLFSEGFKATFGSRKVDYVDKADQPDSLFEKLRIMGRRLPEWMLPEGFSWAKHSNFLRLVNPATGAIISGEGGEDMGRGGRSSIYFVDEAAFVPNAENVEKALSGNTDCVIWISTVNGMGNLFARKRHSVLKPHQIFRLHYSDDPRKTPAWAEAKKASMSDPTSWASEYEIDYTASLEGVCIPAKWVAAAQRLASLIPEQIVSNLNFEIGLDVGAGKAKSVVAARRGPIVAKPRSRGDPDTLGTAQWALEIALELQARLLNFDSPGVGVGVTSGLRHSEDRPKSLVVQPVNTGDPPDERRVWEDGRTSPELFRNLKAELWWLARAAFQRTYQHVLWLEGKTIEEGAQQHPISELISMPKGDPDSDQLAVELSVVKYFKTEAGKIIIESKDQLRSRGIKSPDYADAFVLTFVGRRKSGYSLDHL
jgi:phage terminase large subunit